MTYYKLQKQHASNQNYNTRKSFGQRLKNFFSIPEEDLKEEPSKEFEKIKLFTLTRGSLFLGIFLFMIIINVLVAFNINFLYIRQILGFLFLILIPGLLIMLCFKIRTVKFWEYLVYTVGLSIAFIMFAGLAVNWTLPAVGITDKPLSLWPILIIFDIFLLALWLTAIYRNRDLKPFDITTPKLDTLNNIFFIIPMAFPLLSILGAFLLNNHGPNILTMIMFGAIALYVLLLVLYRKRLNENIWPWAILMISLAILLSGWMRSWFVSGPDISLEYWTFQFIKRNAIWNLSTFNNTYNAMLSLNIFPTILSLFININDHLIFKLFIPIIFSITPLIIYLISKRILSPLFCFFASLLFMSLPDFFNWASIPIRQEIAFIFFGLMILSLFAKQYNSKINKELFVIFGASMIISHYSTAYIALALFILTYILTLIYKIYEDKKIKSGKLHQSQRAEFYLTGALILFLLLFGFLWYNQVTNTAEGLIDFVGMSISNLGNIFNEDTRQGGATDPIFGFFNKPKTTDFIEEYANISLKYDLSNKSDGFSKESYSDYKLRYLPSNTLDPKVKSINLIKINYYAKQIISKIFQLFILLGLLCILINKSAGKDLKIILIAASIIIFSFLFLPFFSIYYSFTRFIQQILIILAPISIIGGRVFFKRLKINDAIGLSLLLIILFLLFSGFSSQIIGGDGAKLQLNNFGGDYDTYYMLYPDFIGAGWLNDNKEDFMIYADVGAGKKLNSYAGNFGGFNANKNLIPSTISKSGYVYLSTINNIKKMGFFVVKSLEINYNYPVEFLNENKHKIYNNGGSLVFK
jgi:uncharacterized membrane protein